MTYQEKVEACKKYTSKLALVNRADLVSQVFKITSDEIIVNLDKLAEVLGSPKTLRIPDFVDRIRKYTEGV